LVVIKTDDQVQTNTSGHVELKDTKFTVSPRIQLAVKLAEELRFQFGVLYRFDRTELSSDDALSFSGQRQGGGGLVLFGFPIHNKYDFSGPNFSICFEYAL
jgi:hypothetical protein